MICAYFCWNSEFAEISLISAWEYAIAALGAIGAELNLRPQHARNLDLRLCRCAFSVRFVRPRGLCASPAGIRRRAFADRWCDWHAAGLTAMLATRLLPALWSALLRVDYAVQIGLRHYCRNADFCRLPSISWDRSELIVEHAAGIQNIPNKCMDLSCRPLFTSLPPRGQVKVRPRTGRVMARLKQDRYLRWQQSMLCQPTFAWRLAAHDSGDRSRCVAQCSS